MSHRYTDFYKKIFYMDFPSRTDVKIIKLFNYLHPIHQI
jgi:hypothetical protein